MHGRRKRNCKKTLETIVTLTKQGVIKNAEKIFLAFIDLLSEIPKTVVQCEQVPASIVKYLDWIAKLKDIKLMMQKLFNAFKDHATEIKNDFENMITAFHNKKLKPCGQHLGDVFYILFEKTEPLSINKLIKNLLN